ARRGAAVKHLFLRDSAQLERRFGRDATALLRGSLQEARSCQGVQLWPCAGGGASAVVRCRRPIRPVALLRACRHRIPGGLLPGGRAETDLPSELGIGSTDNGHTSGGGRLAYRLLQP